MKSCPKSCLLTTALALTFSSYIFKTNYTLSILDYQKCVISDSLNEYVFGIKYHKNYDPILIVGQSL